MSKPQVTYQTSLQRNVWSFGIGQWPFIGNWSLVTGNSLQQAGHTLIELVVGLGIFVVVSTIVTYASIDGWQALVTTRARSSLVTDLDEATIRIESFVRKAASFPGQVTVAGQQYRQDATTLILSVPAVASDGQPVAGVSDTVVYTTRTEGIVELIEPGGGTRTSADRLMVPAPTTASFVITTQTKPLVTATLGATRTGARSPLSRSLTITTLARNAQ